MEHTDSASPLRVQVAETYEAMSAAATGFVIAGLKQRPGLLFCASAGETPTRFYEMLGQQYVRRPGLFAAIRVIQIDEWLGLPRGHPASCAADLKRKLIHPLGVNPQHFIDLRGHTHSPQRECDRIAQWLRRHGPIDICVLGLGSNGHIAMNEPAGRLRAGVHAAALTPTSRSHPMLRSVARKPRQGLTLGMGDILQARKILLLVSGGKKRSALRRLRAGGVTTQFPASLLWLHSDVTVLCDREAT
jgi:galactosamine-6-phosphate isomerase